MELDRPPIEALPPPDSATSIDRVIPRSPSRELEIWTAASIVILLTCLAAALRLYHLSARSFWLDEVLTANAVRVSSLSGVLDEVRARPDQMPLLDIITWLLRGFGGMEWSVRLPSEVAGTLLIPVMYSLGATISRRVGFFAAVLMAISPFAVWYSQEARAYALVMLFASLQMLCAFWAVSNGRLHAWICLALGSILALYTHYTALLTTVTVYGFVGIAMLGEGSRLWRERLNEGHSVRSRGYLRQVGCAGGAMLLTFAAYLPWVGSVGGLVHHEQVIQGTGKSVSAGEAWALLAGLNFDWIVSVCIAVGLAACVVGSRRGSLQYVLVLLWFVAPLIALWRLMGVDIFTILPRYLSVIVPAGVLLAAVGMDIIALTVERVLAGKRMLARAGNTRLLSVVIILPLLGQLLPALAHSYTIPKDDYRDAAARIMAVDPRHAVVLALGPCAPFMVEGLNYYFWRGHSDDEAVDGTLVDDRTSDQLEQQHATAWATVSSDCWLVDTLAGRRVPSLAITQFAGIALIHEKSNTASATGQAEALLGWGTGFDSSLVASISLLRALSHGESLGKNLLPAAVHATASPQYNQWVLAPGTSLSPSRRVFTLTPTGPMVNVTVTLRPVVPGQRDLLTFWYRNSALRGDQRVYVTPQDARGNWITIIPTGAGYLCMPAGTWTEGGFAVTIPPGTKSLLIWFRATGAGQAQFSSISLRPLGTDR